MFSQIHCRFESIVASCHYLTIVKDHFTTNYCFWPALTLGLPTRLPLESVCGIQELVSLFRASQNCSIQFKLQWIFGRLWGGHCGHDWRAVSMCLLFHEILHWRWAAGTPGPMHDSSKHSTGLFTLYIIIDINIINTFPFLFQDVGNKIKPLVKCDNAGCDREFTTTKGMKIHLKTCKTN